MSKLLFVNVGWGGIGEPGAHEVKISLIKNFFKKIKNWEEVE